MPWDINDVSRFKRGLTDAQKRRWVRIANSALASCLARGGNQSTCEGSAIRQASGVVGHSKNNDMEKYIQANTDYNIRTEQHQGRVHIVVPVVMMVEGVHNGSAGPLLHLAEDLGRFPESWNGIPVTVQHPEQDGQNVSANSPDLIDNQTIGRVYNTHMDDGKLKAEVWLDEEKLKHLSLEALNYIQLGRPLEVSIGVFTEEENVPGTWNNIQYEAIARNHRPDHLALLPGGEGACSWAAGCGIRANTKKGGKNKPMDKKELIQMAKSLSKEGYSVTSLISDNEQGLRELIINIQTKLDGMDDNVKIHYLQEVYDDYFIYEVRRSGDGSTLYKRTYQVNTDGSVEFTGEPFEVRRKVEYVAMKAGGFKRTNFSNNKSKKGVTMSKEKETPCKVDELINNKLTKFTEESREWLETLEETVLDTLFPNEPEPQTNKKTEVKSPQVNAGQPKQEPKKEQTLEEYLEGVPEGMQDSMRAGLKLHEEQREKMIKGILANTEKGVWDEEDLKVMDANTLKKVFDSVKKEEVDYSALSVHGVQSGAEQEPLYPGGIEIEEETKK